jgi:plastocyanin
MAMQMFGLAVAVAAAVAAQAFAQDRANVTISDFKFNPDSVSIAPNQPIVWTNKDSVPHQVAVSGGKLKTDVISRGQSKTLSFAESGIYDYICSIHPSMKGKIVVK